MCGLCGTNNLDIDVEKPLRHMRRGEDEKRILMHDGIKFGFQRHAIVSPHQSTTQPYHTDDQVLIANGELFEYERIRSELRNAVLASGSTDIEVLHHYILDNGVEKIAELNMMMAAAVFDSRRKVLSLFRDWVGETPLHYTYDDKSHEWFFASNIATVVRATKQNIDRIFEVPPGSIVTLSSDCRETQCYFDILQTEDVENMDYQEAVRKTRELLEQSAKARTWTGVPVCALVSGGTDSLITLYLLLKNGQFDRPLPIYTFHCEDFDEDENTDLYHAKNVARWFGDKVEHRVVTARKSDLIGCIPEVVESLEDVRGKDYNIFTAIYNRILAEQIAKDGIKLVYEGEGPDEALGSYSAWRSFQYSDEQIGSSRFRKKMVSNLHKGVLPRTSKVMMNFGPLECRSFFLDRDVMTFLSSLPPHLVRKGDTKKKILIDAFKDDIPEELLVRPKARPQDATGITPTLVEYMQKEQLNFRRMFQDFLERLRRA